MRHVVVSLARLCAHLCAGAAIGLLPAALAHASGPVERIAEVLPHPTDPNIIVARYGLPDSSKGTGLLFSTDGGKTFKASCSDFITSGMALSSSESLYKSQIRMDGAGKLIATGFIDEVFVGDATGCGFAKEPGFEIRRGASLAADPTDPKATFMLIFTRDDAAKGKARSSILRRDEAGKWSEVAVIEKDQGPNDNVYGTDLIVTKPPSGELRMAVHYTVYADDTQKEEFRVALSSDGGKTFVAHPLPLSDDEARFRLLGFDPANPDRIIGLEFGEGRKDKLLLSTNGGETFTPWFELDQFSGITYGEGGKVFVTSTNDKIDGSAGGLFTAAKVGDPLTKVPDSINLDCIHYRASDKKLFGCYLDKVGTVDPTSGVFTPVTRLLAIESLIECEGKDVKKSCEKQLNSGTSWCCVGHFPWTPFCGEYSFPNRSMPICGVQAQKWACENIGECGNEGGVIITADGGAAPQSPDGGSTTPRDASVSKPDAGASKPDAAAGSNAGDGAAGDDDDGDDDSGKGGDDGCSASSHATGRELSSTLGLLGLALVLRRMRRRTPR